MKKNLSLSGLFTIVLLVFLLVACKNTTDVCADIEDMNQVFIDMFNSGKTSQLAGCYTAKAKIYPQNRQIIHGHDSIVQFWEEVMSRGISKIDLLTCSAERMGNSAYEEGQYKIYTAAGKEADEGKYLVIWKKENGHWKMHRAIWNTNHPSSEYRLPELLN